MIGTVLQLQQLNRPLDVGETAFAELEMEVGVLIYRDALDLDSRLDLANLLLTTGAIRSQRPW